MPNSEPAHTTSQPATVENSSASEYVLKQQSSVTSLSSGVNYGNYNVVHGTPEPMGPEATSLIPVSSALRATPVHLPQCYDLPSCPGWPQEMGWERGYGQIRAETYTNTAYCNIAEYCELWDDWEQQGGQ